MRYVEPILNSDEDTVKWEEITFPFNRRRWVQSHTMADILLTIEEATPDNNGFSFNISLSIIRTGDAPPFPISISWVGADTHGEGLTWEESFSLAKEEAYRTWDAFITENLIARHNINSCACDEAGFHAMDAELQFFTLDE